MTLNLFQWSIAAIMCIALLCYQRHASWTPMRVCGAVLCLVAFGLVSLARYQLGRSFSVTPQARQLVTTGLYARIRNPIYVFAELFLAGLALYLQSWWPFAVMVAIIPLQMMRTQGSVCVGSSIRRGISPIQGKDLVLTRFRRFYFYSVLPTP